MNYSWLNELSGGFRAKGPIKGIEKKSVTEKNQARKEGEAFRTSVET